MREDLYVGDARDAENHETLAAAGVTAVVKLTRIEPEADYPTFTTVSEVPLIDGPQNDHADMETAVATLADLLDDDETVFVHCSAGASRSVTVAAGGLALEEGCSLSTALERVVETHPPSHPHPALAQQAQTAVRTLREDDLGDDVEESSDT